MDQSTTQHSSVSRRGFMAAGAATVAGAATIGARVEAAEKDAIVEPPQGKQILLSCKLGMIAKQDGGKKLSLVERLSLAGKAGFDGVDFDQAGAYTPQQVRDAVSESGVFVHNAINHAHWGDRLTSPDEKVRAKGRANIEHCMRVSHAAGGCGVLIVVGHAKDGSADEVDRRCQAEINKLLPLAAALGQPILVENVWNQMHYKHSDPPEQTAREFIEFVDSFNSPWVGMYYDIGNHWKYGQPGDWIRAFGRRCVKLDVKGFSRAKDKFTEIGAGDLPWDEVRKALADIGFTGWATAEVGGGGLERLSKVCGQMKKALYN